uniref:Uncharacterized protein n=1 Tax=Brassica oleracea TaxID=3712 RepID=A0A3P6E1V0_BRAOL|nr:unnamed protein product [Brassica oleracea]
MLPWRQLPFWQIQSQLLQPRSCLWRAAPSFALVVVEHWLLGPFYCGMKNLREYRQAAAALIPRRRFWTRSLVVTHAAASLDPFVVTFSPPIWVTTTSAAPLAVASHPTPLFSAASHAPLVVASIIAPYPLSKSRQTRPFPIALSYGSRVFQLFLRANSFRQSSIKIPGQDHTPMLLSVMYTLSKEKESLPSPVLVSTNCLQTRCLGSPVVGSYSDFSMFFGTSVSGFQVKHLYGYLRPFNTLIALLFVYCLAVEINSGCNRLNPFDF